MPAAGAALAAAGGRRLQASGLSGGAGESHGGHGYGQRSHDTIAMVAIDGDGRVAAGASTNGMTYKARIANHLACKRKSPHMCSLSAGRDLALGVI